MGGPADRAPAVLTVDLAAIVDNWRQLRDRALPAACAAVVKADAYGLGAAEVASALAAGGCRTFFVATLDEGLSLRRTLADRRTGSADAAEIYVLGGAPRGCETDLIAARLRPVLNSLGDIDAYAAHARSAGIRPPVAVHLDTGMSRLGLSDTEQATIASDPSRLDGLDLCLVMSHLACADEPEHPLNAKQLALFRAAAASLPAAARSFANSSGIFLGRDYVFDLVRPGAALYGVAPNGTNPNPMRGVVRLHGRIVQVREIDTPRTVGYGATHRVQRGSRIATVSVGYADGYLRSLGNRGSGFLAGQRIPVVGRVSMDLITFDVSNIPAERVVPGHMVELIGPDLPVDAVAAAANTIGYEILTSLGSRYHRVYSPAGEDAC